MGLMILSCIAAIVFIMLGFSGVRAAEKSENKETPAAASPAEPETKNATRDEIRKKLRKLAETDAPQDLSTGAMCYRMASPPDRAEYVCPTCNEKTLHVSEKEKRWTGVARLVAWELPACRRLVKQIKNLKVTLVESSLCKKCQPDAKKHELGLAISYAGEAKPQVISPISVDDLNLLVEFTTGKLKHDAGQEGEVPLKSRMKRLKELLGTAEDKPKEK